jgi:hypothetical protein
LDDAFVRGANIGKQRQNVNLMASICGQPVTHSSCRKAGSGPEMFFDYFHRASQALFALPTCNNERMACMVGALWPAILPTSMGCKRNCKRSIPYDLQA